MKQLEREIRLLQVAEDDLREITNYIALDNLAAATALLDKIENSLSALFLSLCLVKFLPKKHWPAWDIASSQ